MSHPTSLSGKGPRGGRVVEKVGRLGQRTSEPRMDALIELKRAWVSDRVLAAMVGRR